jgi:uncharacterized protein (DUF2147 family)
MKKWLPITFVLLSYLLFTCRAFADVQPSIIGYWTTIDDVTHTPRSMVKIWEATNGTYQGQLIKAYMRPGETENDICDKCTDLAHKNQKIKGMVILWSMQQTGTNQWSNGLILDPKSGKIYNCNIFLDPTGQKLSVRGFIGISLLGRTQTWLRTTEKGQSLL